VLTEEQKTSFREAIQSQREKVREIEEKLRDARKELLEAGLKEKFDEEAVRQKAMAAAKLEAEMMVIRAKAFSQMRPPLSTEQIEKLRTMLTFGDKIAVWEEDEDPTATVTEAVRALGANGRALAAGANAEKLIPDIARRLAARKKQPAEVRA